MTGDTNNKQQTTQARKLANIDPKQSTIDIKCYLKYERIDIKCYLNQKTKIKTGSIKVSRSPSIDVEYRRASEL